MLRLTGLIVLLSALASADQSGPVRFLDGFPDVPLIADAEAMSETHMVFDTPAGTVGRAVLKSSLDERKLVRDYYTGLSALGWSCEQNEEKLSCRRDHYSLVIRSVALTPKNGAQLELRLDPFSNDQP